MLKQFSKKYGYNLEKLKSAKWKNLRRKVWFGNNEARNWW